MNRGADIFISFVAAVILLPLFFIISVLILLDSQGGIIFKQSRVGKNNHDFYLYKFRSMYRNSDKKGLITTGSSDSRVTRAGRFLRKYKLDELPQLFNILKGDMSIVGPRPEVRKYVDLYTPEQQRVLSLRPGLTDYASLEYINEGELLAGAEDPETLYIREIMPAKLRLNLQYIDEKSAKTDFRIILETIGRIFSAG
jgi:lipopolysaccharide/colanic/teichoic acid biosynthesis glycosyltransferase